LDHSGRKADPSVTSNKTGFFVQSNDPSKTFDDTHTPVKDAEFVVYATRSTGLSL